ncbi:MAG: hypothetical protein WC769_13050 [Thermodesulfovibrionales bacterium]|jgi:hypothetical protein
MEICSASENGEVYQHIPDIVLIEKLKSAEKKINNAKNLLDEFIDIFEKEEASNIASVFYKIRRQLTD